MSTKAKTNKHWHVSYVECEGTQYAHPVSFIVRSAKTAQSQRKSAKVTECVCTEGMRDLRVQPNGRVWDGKD